MNNEPAQAPEWLPTAGGLEAPSTDPVGFWVRAGAAFIDGLVLSAGVFGLSLGVGLAVPDPRLGARILQAATLLFGAGYFTLTTGRRGQTLGKMAAGIVVVNRHGSRIGYGRALGRWAAYSLSALPLGFGFAAAMFTDRSRTLHDFVAGTEVVYLNSTEWKRKTGMAVLGAMFAAALAVIAVLTVAEPPSQANYRDRLLAEGAAVGNLRSLRSILAVYEARTGKRPEKLEELSSLGDFPELPELALPDHAPSRQVEAYAGTHAGGVVDPAKLKDTGHWAYVGDEKDPQFGTIFIDCTHVDSQGVAWYEY